MVVGCQPYAPAALTPRKYSWYSFLLEAESTPGPQCDRKDFMSMKNPLTPTGIEPATFLFVAQHLIMCSTCFGHNISIFRSLRLLCWITTLVALLLVRCVLEFRCGWVGVVSVLPCNTDTTSTQPHRNSNTHRTKNNATNVVIQQSSRKLFLIDILMSETCWAHKKWNKIASDIKLVFYSSTITMMHGPVSLRWL